VKLGFVLPRPEPGGGIKVVAHQAALLAAAGWEVTLLAPGPRPPWFPPGPRYVDLEAGRPHLAPQDLVIATFWTTVAEAEALALGPVTHYCQGYEGDLEHLAAQRPAIEAAYRRPGPALAVAPALATALEQTFARPVRVLPPVLDEAYRPLVRWRPRRRPWVFLPGIFEAPVKGVETALRALALLAGRGVVPRLVRLSLLPLSAEERSLFVPEVYLCEVRPDLAAAWLRRADLLLLPSMPGEGFGLPLLEAMASGVPAVASRLPAIEWMVGEQGALLTEPGDASGMAEAAAALLADPSRWRAQRRFARAAAGRFRAAAVLGELQAAIRWAAAEAARPGGRSAAGRRGSGQIE
jgi:hypothetical protein